MYRNLFRAPLHMLLCLLSLSPSLYAAVTPLNNCFNGPGEYEVNYSRELNASENKANKTVDVTEHLVGSGADLVANCSCPKNVSGSTPINILSLAGSPLAAGTSGYGYLTSHLDLAVDGYSEASSSSDGYGLSKLPIKVYPTPLAQMPDTIETSQKVSEANVCSESTTPTGVTAANRKLKWNVIGIRFYVKKPILGEEVIPSTIVLQNYACLYYGSGSCDPTLAQQVSNIRLQGSLSAPLSCTINEGSTIEVEFNNLVSSQFVTQEQPPKKYSLKEVNISYHCDDNAADNNDRIKLTLSADQGVVDGSNPVIAKTIGRDDLGIRIFSEDNKSVALDNSFEFPATTDELGNGVIKIKATPVSVGKNLPKAGSYESSVTVKMDLR